MGAIASQITSPTIVYPIVNLNADQRKHQSFASLAFLRGIDLGPLNSPHKGPVTRNYVSIWWRHHESRNQTISFKKEAFKHVICEMAAILFWPYCVYNRVSYNNSTQAILAKGWYLWAWNGLNVAHYVISSYSTLVIAILASTMEL